MSLSIKLNGIGENTEPYGVSASKLYVFDLHPFNVAVFILLIHKLCMHVS